MNPIQSLSLFFIDALGVSAPAAVGLGLSVFALCLIGLSGAVVGCLTLLEKLTKKVTSK